MKVYVITAEDGALVGTARAEYRHGDGASFGFKPTALNGQKVRELQLPAELENETDPAALHRAIEKHLK